LQSGGTDFSEDTARQYCQHLGCYDSPNHSKYLKGFGNKITGSKDSGWKLTAPGLTAAAKLICPVEEDEK
jgi:Rieske Fe-S protein